MPRQTDLHVELLPLHSQLLGESWLVSFPPLNNMLKSSGSSYLISGQRGKVPRGEARRRGWGGCRRRLNGAVAHDSRGAAALSQRFGALHADAWGLLIRERREPAAQLPHHASFGLRAGTGVAEAVERAQRRDAGG